MRILEISSVKNFGGGERHLVDLTKGLHSRGHEVFICWRPGAGWKNQLSFLPGENLFELTLRNSFDLHSAYQIAGIVRHRNIEIIHAHAARDYSIAALAARFTGAKLVLTRHLLFPLNPLHKFLLPKDTAFIAVTKAVRRRLSEQRLLPPEQIHLIYNAVDALHFQTAKETADREKLLEKLKLPLNAFLVGIVGEIAAHKGQADFIRAARLVLKRVPAAEFLIVGRDDPAQKNQYREEIEKLITEFGLEEKIHFSGWLEDIAPLFAVLDVLVSASHFESFGLSIVEAMAAGCAVVATETEGAKEIIENDETGKLVPIGKPDVLANAISEFLCDETRRKKIGIEAQKSAVESFDIKRMIDETERLFKTF